jgi:hypothetical protein
MVMADQPRRSPIGSSPLSAAVEELPYAGGGAPKPAPAAIDIVTPSGTSLIPKGSKKGMFGGNG